MFLYEVIKEVIEIAKYAIPIILQSYTISNNNLKDLNNKVI